MNRVTRLARAVAPLRAECCGGEWEEHLFDRVDRWLMVLHNPSTGTWWVWTHSTPFEAIDEWTLGWAELGFELRQLEDLDGGA